ncbi:MAG: aspartate kinase [Christensenellales bacterium]
MGRKMKELVCKFGGSSLADANRVMQVAKIVNNSPARFVVVSAPGKRNKQDIKITDILLSCYKKAEAKESFDVEFNLFATRMEELDKELGTGINIREMLKNFYTEIAGGATESYVASRGEYFSAKIVSKYLGYNFLDAKDFITFSSNGKVDFEISKMKFVSHTNNWDKYVIPGFYGADANGNVKIFSRGGSDITGAVVAVLCGAKVYENWTDVDGFLQCDPRFSKNPKLIAKISYAELRELSYAGANVLHPDCTRFLRENNIVLNLRNTFNPTCKGSFIMPKCKQKKLTGIAGQKGFCIISFEKFNINSSLNFVWEVYNAFAKNGVGVEHIPTGIDNISVVARQNEITDDKLKKIVEQISQKCALDGVSITKDVALVSVVGAMLNQKTERNVIEQIYTLGTKIFMLNKSTQGLSIIFAFPQKDFEKVLKTLHKNLFCDK